MTKISEDYGWSPESVRERENEIEQVRERLSIRPEHLFQLDFPTTRLDTIPMGDLIAKVSETFQIFKPEDVLLPHQGDVHSDHRITFESVTACTKWFRYPFVKRLLAYETLSETEFNLDPSQTFIPNVFMEISPYLEQKLELLRFTSQKWLSFHFLEVSRILERLRQFVVQQQYSP